MTRVLFVSALNSLSEIENRLQPLWPCYLAAYAESRAEAGTLEFRYATSGLEGEFRDFRPDIVAISSVTKNFGLAKSHAAAAKKAGAAVIVGGMHVSALPASISPHMDVACMGEGEETFAELLDLYRRKRAFSPADLHNVAGIAFHDKDIRVTRKRRVMVRRMEDLPHPKRSLVGYGRRGYLHTTRGCASRCRFCACGNYWGELRMATPSHVAEEIGELVQQGARALRFNDDNFLANPERLAAMRDIIRRNGFHRRVKFSCWGRADCVQSETVRLLREMNVVSVKLGLESGSDRILSLVKGEGCTAAKNLAAVRLLRGGGIQANADFIIGFPEETREDLHLTAEFIRKAPLNFVDISLLTPLPGTPYWDSALARGMVGLDMDWSGFDFRLPPWDRRAMILSEKLSREEICGIYRSLKRLSLAKKIRSLPMSPWISELPAVLYRKARGACGFLGRSER